MYDRLGEVRGFSTSDVQMLQTIANHASVALHNEMLIGRLRHGALHVAGIALAPEHGRLVSDLLKRADIAMYAAKNGANSSVLYRPDIDLHDPSLLSHGRAARGDRGR